MTKMKPSKFQQAIYDFVECEARALLHRRYQLQRGCAETAAERVYTMVATTFKSFRALQSFEQRFERERKTALVRDEMSSAWRWFENNVDYKSDAALSLRRVHSHGHKGTFKTLAPARCRKEIAA